MSQEDNKIKIVHCMIKKYDVYIGRGKGPWGNPYTHKDGVKATKVDTRKEAIEKYKEYILNNPKLLKRLPELKGKILGCWCAKKDQELTADDTPYICHGQVLAELIENSGD